MKKIEKIKTYKCWVELEEDVKAKSEEEAINLFKNNFDLTKVDFCVTELK